MDAADGAGPGLESLMDDNDGPDGQPKAQRAEREHEVDRVAGPPPAKYPRETARAAIHDAVLVVVPRDMRRAVGVVRRAGPRHFPDRVFIHSAYCTGKNDPRAMSAYMIARVESAAAIPQIARIIGVIQTPCSKSGS